MEAETKEEIPAFVQPVDADSFRGWRTRNGPAFELENCNNTGCNYLPSLAGIALLVFWL